MSARSSSSSHERWRNSTSGCSGASNGAAAAISSFASARLHDPRVVLEQHAAQLPRGLERRERLAELAERGLAVGLLVPGHRGARLRVPGEVVRRALGPLRGRLRGGKAVERRVDLDDVEALGVVGEARGRRGHSPRVPVLDEALVGPRARADPDHGHAVRLKRRARSRGPLVCYFFGTSRTFVDDTAVNPLAVALMHETPKVALHSDTSRSRAGALAVALT